MLVQLWACRPQISWLGWLTHDRFTVLSRIMECLLLAVSLLLLMVAAPSLTASLPKQELRWGAISSAMEHLSGSLECDACKLGVGVIQDLFSRLEEQLRTRL